MRKAIWQLWYPYLTRRLRSEDLDVVFLNYAFESDPAAGLALSPEDEVNRGCIQLYHHVATQSGYDLAGKTVLEVSCGHGGGASWLTRTFSPASYTGLDLNPTGIAFCQKHHQVPGLTFQQGDAQHLPFPDAAFDAVINVEASHCYPDFPGFLAGVAQVLRPGGSFLYADFRFREEFSAWDLALAQATSPEGPFALAQSQDIGVEVLRGMDGNAARNLELVKNRLPKILQPLGRDFAGVPGSKVYEALKSGDLSYRSWHLVRL